LHRVNQWHRNNRRCHKKSPLLRMEPYLPLLLGPGIRQGFGEPGDRKIRSRGAIGRDDAGRQKGEWCQ
jgi:hypothetical protein